ncbi:hypothetical protein Tco_0802347 [Tanacetum coccineum]|uniref:Uncharacterized protein n=1 Tax=Tanacetum coccineum TaxID=301880 RepID=A0ABQ4ZYK2_9ASTR
MKMWKGCLEATTKEGIQGGNLANLVAKGGGRGACKLLGDIRVRLWRCLDRRLLVACYGGGGRGGCGAKEGEEVMMVTSGGGVVGDGGGVGVVVSVGWQRVAMEMI